MSPFIDNEAEGYLPDRQREINSLAGIESNIAGPAAFGDDSSDEESKGEENEEGQAAADPKNAVNKGDIDSSSDEEGPSEELSDSEEEDVSKVKKGPGKKAQAVAAPAKAPAKAAKKI